MSTINRAGLRIHYTDDGDGSAILFLSGLGASLKAWGPALGGLRARHRCIAVDNRGSGESDAATSRFGIREMAADAVAVLDACGVVTAHVVGNSMGGLIAQALALQHPQRVRSLTLVAATPGVLSVPFRRSFLATLVEAMATRQAGPVVRALHGPLYRGAPEEASQADGFVFDRVTRAQLRAAMSWPGLLWLHRIAAPTAIIHGTEDSLVPVANARLMARRIRGATLHLLHGAGHALLSDATEEVTSAIRQFLDSVDAFPWRNLGRLSAMPAGVLTTS